ncbi:DUF6339 family protein [Bacillus safensis]|uniref:DUF6339 family protein n=1 Tax=Bacillus safensis TaxID=561879 RepID=UPI0009BF07F9|nr:DUF6339 family protein [Bacillus safensis]ARD57148.1 hypothetical protein BRL64_13525 [Bacillus safensis]
MNNLTLMKEAMLSNLKENISENISYYETGNNVSFREELNFSGNTELNLIVSDATKRSIDDLQNAINLYEHFKDLPLPLASEEAFWSFLTHTSFWDYMSKRWPIPIGKTEGDQIEFIKTRFFFHSKRKTFYRNGLSRLWWYVYLTQDSTLSDEYHYSRIILSYQDTAGVLIETPNLSRNKTALKAVLDVIAKIYELEEKKAIKLIKNKRILIRNLAKYINLVGGVTVWDKLTQQDAYDKAWVFIDKYVEYVTTQKQTV